MGQEDDLGLGWLLVWIVDTSDLDFTRSSLLQALWIAFFCDFQRNRT